MRVSEKAATVLLVDDHAVVRRGLTAYLDMVDDITVVGEAKDGRDALRYLAESAVRPDVVLMDLLMPGIDGVEATSVIARDYPGVAVVVLTSFGEGERVRAALEAGASGYLLKDAEPEEVADAVRAAMRGETRLSGRVARCLTRELSAPGSGLAALTSREREILKLVAQGCSNREIAQRLTISERTARTHVSNVLAKLQLASRTQAALLAIREGLVPPPGTVE
ncbi:response regulator containing a CheY-like receiver domain and an HTH DNA-binding domain [Saccharomonospora marina XMU15]|uniref:Response regulator containing a CheY-like receiver domain and an HTH DNA-binding domain n=1 Tax=Saccharomonospora marina XMU15 TaxID=882083 RepID=H5X3Y1_9PSEU|nr:response regulator transcription factor [Saccharomonospora marina]EHR52199.1 response regulator containing a CheY-like receiver domain and an HTH DNA-binding domain [Saccharomonospora marina XMU15]